MPIYDFECTNCNHVEELMRKISAPNVVICPKCKLETFAKKISAPAFQLNGTGWYATDFKSNGKKSPAPETKQDADPVPACSPGCACH